MLHNLFPDEAKTTTNYLFYSFHSRQDNATSRWHKRMNETISFLIFCLESVNRLSFYCYFWVFWVISVHRMAEGDVCTPLLPAPPLSPGRLSGCVRLSLTFAALAADGIFNVAKMMGWRAEVSYSVHDEHSGAPCFFDAPCCLWGLIQYTNRKTSADYPEPNSGKWSGENKTRQLRWIRHKFLKIMKIILFLSLFFAKIMIIHAFSVFSFAVIKEKEILFKFSI